MSAHPLTDEAFITATIRHLEHMFAPDFGRRKFFNRELFDYVLALAGEDVERLRQEVHALARDSHHPEWDIQVRADNTPPRPAVYLKIMTPSRLCTLTIHRDGIDAAHEEVIASA